jgi:hypothetical protein
MLKHFEVSYRDSEVVEAANIGSVKFENHPGLREI